MINFKSLFPIVIGFSFWIYGNILLIKKLQNKTSEIREPKSSIEVSIDQDLKDKNKNEKKDLINLVKNKESFHLNSLITKNISLFTKNPNYKMLAWLIVQLTIFSLFVLSVNIFKNNLIPYFNAWNLINWIEKWIYFDFLRTKNEKGVLYCWATRAIFKVGRVGMDRIACSTWILKCAE